MTAQRLQRGAGQHVVSGAAAVSLCLAARRLGALHCDRAAAAAAAHQVMGVQQVEAPVALRPGRLGDALPPAVTHHHASDAVRAWCARVAREAAVLWPRIAPVGHKQHLWHPRPAEEVSMSPRSRVEGPGQQV